MSCKLNARDPGRFSGFGIIPSVLSDKYRNLKPFLQSLFIIFVFFNAEF